MTNYFIGDIHGCYRELMELIDKIDFDPISDTLWITGDMLSRGPESVRVLRYIKSLGDSSKIVLGNHELSMINLFYNNFKKKFFAENEKKENIRNNIDFQRMFLENDIEDLVIWLKSQPILQIDSEKKIIMVHAGIHPYWSLQDVISYARDIENFIRIEEAEFFERFIQLNRSYRWKKKYFNNFEKIKFNINVFTRMRYCYKNGNLNMNIKDDYQVSKCKSFKPWFLFDRKIDRRYSIVFGHWSSLNGKCSQKNIYPMDTGCCWGRRLTALRWEDKRYFDVPCMVRKIQQF
ncbi:symmetrical bis(5'-nucleosyl)-tetraphosphatase [Candidatus Riesia pediculischaeffi]|uniref:bis(5'-nucleosyl)-tetraphosphatase (symmetrical) n=1 Tax=Candidatus Riesia pediculischaeffi TaxID=428411 RepID=A0A1V0HKB8_9ENTR|nr:symmetrical bis(5'-nucleosyl)-tetraphosphatase [Candidatus Riesia pediculischaeffi]ARC53263.1 hypothetical protein AOQ87_00995 [Candidatus Riesia pediculischaeffi]